MKAKLYFYYDLPVPLFLEMAAARKLHFIDRFGWDIPTYVGGNYEIDQFDHSAASYVVFEDEEGIYGSLRLLPHIASMTREIWPQLYSSIPKDYVEVSRMCLHGKTTRARTEASAKAMKNFMAYSKSQYYGCADKYMLRTYPLVLGLNPIKVIPDPEGNPEINIALFN